MIDLTVVIATAETSLLDVARQTSGLATGLQNAAPGDKSNAPNKSVQYLFEISERLNEIAEKCKKLISLGSQEQYDKLHEWARDVVQYDKDLREKYQIGDKFRFIRDRINVVFANVEEALNALKKESVKEVSVLGEGEVMVYVYLFNAHGITLQTWHKMVTPSIFYDHSINRPIYIERPHIESFISRKTNKVQHGFLTIVINKQDILKGEGADSLKDIYDNPIIKVREGSLLFKKLVSFTHNEHEYVVDEEGNLVKKK
jgi:hypothetical protein